MESEPHDDARSGDHGDDAARRGAHGGPAGHREGGGTAHAGLRLRRRRPRLSRRSNYGELLFYLLLTDLNQKEMSILTCGDNVINRNVQFDDLILILFIYSNFDDLILILVIFLILMILF